jgi:hypothetical protein
MTEIPPTAINLGRLEQVDPRSIWPHEAHHFTPWLFGNADRLAESLGIDLELEATEYPVGGYSLDIIGKDQSHGVVLIVENQLTDSDHGHLGQLLTYAAGTNASTIIWLTTRFRDEHRQALTWLNEHTDPETFFFGVEIEIVRIGASEPAPQFNVVVMPNDWQKQAKQAGATAGSASTKNELYRQFWTKLLERVKEEHPGWTRATAPAQNWLWISAPIRGCGLNPVFGAHNKLRIELYIDRATPEACTDVFDALATRKSDFEAAYGRPLEWARMENRKACRVSKEMDGDISCPEDYDRYIEFFVDGSDRFRRAIAAVAGQLL